MKHVNYDSGALKVAISDAIKTHLHCSGQKFVLIVNGNLTISNADHDEMLGMIEESHTATEELELFE